MKLVGDIGGTNARFALMEDEGTGLMHTSSLKCASYATLADAAQAYVDSVSQPMPKEAIIAIAAPVMDDWVDMTNHTWLLSVDDIRMELELDKLKVVNDFIALALAVPTLDDANIRQIGRGFKDEGSAIGVLGAGTGLGMSGLISTGDIWMPIESEGGHIPFWSYEERDIKVLEIIRKRYKLVSAEMIVSGPGLALVYQAIAELEGLSLATLSPAEISERATKGIDSVAVETVRFFSGALGAVAASLALIISARGGVYIGGGVVPKLGSAFDEALFRAHFEKSSEFQPYLSDVPTYVMDANFLALQGSMIAGRPEYEHLGVTSTA